MSWSPCTFFLPNSPPAIKKIASTMATIPPSRRPKVPPGPLSRGIPSSDPLRANAAAAGEFPRLRRPRALSPHLSQRSQWGFLPPARSESRSMNAPGKKTKLFKGASGEWEIVIGMEVHAQITSNAKLFSGASTAFGGEPNSHVSLVDAAMPGMLPVINRRCVEQAVKTGLGLKAKINKKSVFDRKNYFYPDLPQGYQISQYKSPVVGEGKVTVDMADGEGIEVGIER